MTQSFQRLEIWSNIRLHVASESSTFTQIMFTSEEKHSLKSWILSIFHTKRIKSCLKTWTFLFPNLFALREETYKETATTEWIGKHVPISVSVWSNQIREPIFLCNSDPRHLVSSFIGALEGLATQSEAQKKGGFFEVETAIKIKLSSILNNSTKDTAKENESEKKELSTQSFRMQKNQLIDLQEHFERYGNTVPVFGFNSAKYDIHQIKSYLLPILVNERQNEPTVIKKVIQFVCFKFSYVQLLDNMNFLGGATSLDSFPKAYKADETKVFSPMSGSTIRKS